MRLSARRHPREDCANPFAVVHLLRFCLRNAWVVIAALAAFAVYPRMQKPAPSPAPAAAPPLQELASSGFVPGDWRPWVVSGPVDEGESQFVLYATHRAKRDSVMLLWDTATNAPRYIRSIPTDGFVPDFLLLPEEEQLLLRQWYDTPEWNNQNRLGLKPQQWSDWIPDFKTPYDIAPDMGRTRLAFLDIQSGQTVRYKELSFLYDVHDIDWESDRLLGYEYSADSGLLEIVNVKTGEVKIITDQYGMTRFDGPAGVLFTRKGCRCCSEPTPDDGVRIDLATGKTTPISQAEASEQVRLNQARDSDITNTHIQGNYSIILKACQFSRRTGEVRLDPDAFRTPPAGNRAPAASLPLNEATFWTVNSPCIDGSETLTSSTLPLYFAGPDHIMVHELDTYRFERTEDFLRTHRGSHDFVYTDESTPPLAPNWRRLPGRL